MSTELQAVVVTEHTKYLEEKLQVLEPVIEVMKNAVEKSQTWIADQNVNPSITYTELRQQLKSATTTMLDAAAQILNDDDKVNVEPESSTSSLSTSLTISTNTSDNSELKNQISKQVKHTAEILTRLELIETAISSLQDTKQKTEDDISEIKQWRDTFVSEQNDTALKTEQFCRQEEKCIESLREQINEQDSKVKELNKELESLKQQESKSNKVLEKLSVDINEYENNLHALNTEMNDNSNKTDSIAHAIRIHCSIISLFQDDVQQNIVNTTCKLNDIFSKLKTQASGVTKLENQLHELSEFSSQVCDVLKLKHRVHDILRMLTDFKITETSKCQPYVCQIHLDNDTPVTVGNIMARFYVVWESYGRCFNKTTGKLVAPEDGLYLVNVTLLKNKNHFIKVAVFLGDVLCNEIFVKSALTSACGSTVVPMKKGEELFFKVAEADVGAKLQGGSGFTIVRL
ncbi:putative leucine-rich repeat-containing protein DDB_G0290503 [Physella acuta]|uniref:putative leucine-rich repeat-containing protein DDB_G0290503 n=1 Tax=Physella acuta TaxID=109671 RepID=UPI0027DD7D7A|nr:putative leucine-rich repeat-containing protein DDB_G0290503 [Physella acuta]XP_059162674.1 putative leucine-rich repeat-containing protein DDB_G0290503 [Physella acuta]